MGRINKIKRGYLKLVKYILIGLTFIFKPIFDFLNPYIKPIAFKVYAQLSKSTDYLSSYLNRCLIFPINAKIIQPIAKRLGKRWARRVKYGLSCLALIAIITVAALTIINHIVDDSYHLPLSIQAMIGPADTTLMKSQLSYSSKTKTYYIDKSGIGAKSSSAAGIPSGGNSITIGSHSNSAFSLVIPTNIHQGFTTYDNTSGLSFTLTPQFDARSGRIVDNHLVYPMGLSSTKDVYTIKGNGLQENIVYNSAPKGTIKLSYKLTLPSSLQARMMSDGDIGIYSAGSYLFGNISYGSPKDQALVAKARLNAAKTTLVFILPAPQVADSDGNAPSNIQQHTKFSLKGNILTLIASDLGGINGPLSIDPSVIDASASAFQRTGNNESDISFAGSSVSEAGLSGGGLSGNTNSCGVSWCASSTTANTGFSLPVGDYGASAVVYNGYIYFMGGYTFGQIPTVDYAVLNTNGSLGAPTTCTGGTQETDWCESSTSANTGFSLPTATGQATAVVYNGYIYFMGGGNSGVPTVDYVALSANGSLTAPPTCAGTQETDWCESSTTANTGFSLPTATEYASAVVYNGYIYYMGGYTGSSVSTDYYAPIYNGGGIGPWSSTTKLPTATYQGSAAVYNGNIYFMGGYTSIDVPTVDYAAISSVGDPTSWTASSATANTGFSLPTSTGNASAVAYNGYIYFMGGQTSSNAAVPTVDYALLNANGSLGAPATCTGGTQETDWCESSTTANTGFSLPTASVVATAVVYNGYIYFMGGEDISGNTLPTVDYALLNANGSLGAPATCTGGTQETDWCESSTTANTGFSLPTATELATTVAYNGFIYFMGGENVSGTTIPTVDYVALNSNGSLVPPATCTGGTQETDWCESSTTANTGFSLPTATAVPTAVAYNGFIYFIAGQDGGGNALSTVDYAVLNANGSLGAPSTCAGTQETDWCESSTSTSIGFSLPTDTYDAFSVAYNGYIYFMGGYISNYVPTIDYSLINNGGPGTINSWTTTTSLPSATYDAASTIYNNYIYQIAGYVGGVQSSTVDYAQIGPSGALVNTLSSCPSGWTLYSSTWCYNTSSLPFVIIEASAVAYNGYIYLEGGSRPGNSPGTAYYAPINSNGSIGSWTATSAITTYNTSTFTTGNIWYTSTVEWGGYIYALGGETAGSKTIAFQSAVYYALINPNGTLGSWTTTTSLPVANGYASAVAYNGYIYLIGGASFAGNSTAVDYAKVGSSGGLVTSVSSCPSGWTLYSSTWCYNSTSLPNGGVYLASAGAYNGYIYVIGGSPSSTSVSTVDYTSINSNGSLSSSPWTATTSLPTATQEATSVVYNGYIYEIGGYTTAATATVDIGSLNSITRIGFYSELIDMSGSSTEDPSADALLLNGTQTGNPGIGNLGLPGTGGITVNYQFGSNVCPTLSSSSVLTTTPLLIGKPYYMTSFSNGCSSSSDTNFGRWVWLTIKLDDSLTDTFPDSSSNHTTITGLTLYYHPAANGRLRGGGTFSSGANQTLDAPP